MSDPRDISLAEAAQMAVDDLKATEARRTALAEREARDLEEALGAELLASPLARYSYWQASLRRGYRQAARRIADRLLEIERGIPRGDEDMADYDKAVRGALRDAAAVARAAVNDCPLHGVSPFQSCDDCNAARAQLAATANTHQEG